MAVPGNVVVVRYDVVGGEVWHERIILCSGPTAGSYGVLTPDYDVYIEDYTAGNTDIHTVRIGGGLGLPPADVPAARVYGFQVPLPDENTMSGYVRDAVLQSGSAMPALPLDGGGGA